MLLFYFPCAELCDTLAFRQHFLTFVHNEYKKRGMTEVFLRNITQYRLLKMYRIQMVGPEIVLIRLEHRGTPHNLSWECALHPSV